MLKNFSGLIYKTASVNRYKAPISKSSLKFSVTLREQRIPETKMF